MKYCDTPRGAAAVAQANVMLGRFARWAQADVWLTDPHQTPAVDALFARGGVVRAFAEAKTRPTLTLHGLHEFQSLLISANKIQALVNVTSIVYGLTVLTVMPVAHLIYVELRRMVRRYRVRRLMRQQR